MIKILFICHGNICRSAAAQYVLQDMVDRAQLSDQFLIDSAATSREEIGNPVYPPAKRKLNQEGIRCDGYAARKMLKEDYDRYDYIIGMDRQNIRALQMMQPAGSKAQVLEMASFLRHHQSDSVPDPYYGGDAQFEHVISLLEDACASLLDWLTEA